MTPTGPGLVVSLGNWARPRDMAHFEQFRHYHETFYAQVEALSVTPFSPTSLERGIDGVLVSVARVVQAHRANGLSPERDAWRIRTKAALQRHADRLKAGSLAAAQQRGRHQACQRAADQPARPVVRARQTRSEMSKTLVYERTGESDKYLPLIISPENAKATGRRLDAGAVRDRELDARGPAGDQPAGQPAAGAALRASTPDGCAAVEPARWGRTT